MDVSRTTRSAVAAALLLLLPLAGCGGRESSSPSGAAHLSAAQAQARVTGRETNATRYVLAISVDALNAHALDELGRSGAPNFHRLMAHGADTLNARTELERTLTLPNHTGMLTGRRVSKSSGGHGIGFNHDNHRTVQQNAGHPVGSVFQVVHQHGRSTALFASKSKFAMFERSWPRAIDRFTVNADNRRLVAAVRGDLVRHHRAFTFVHLSHPDDVGHAKGFMTTPYLRAVQDTDRRLGDLLRTIDTHPALREHLTIVLTSDHGGAGRGHGDATDFTNYRVPFIVWGAGVHAGSSLYDLSDDFTAPGFARPTYRAARQPIRNADLANLSTDLLGFGPVPGSELNADQSLVVR